MNIKFSKEAIEFEKSLSDLDKFTLDFASILEKQKINYVVVSGYVSILFGRNRTSEDIDLFIEKISFETFSKLWGELSDAFECINTSDVKEAYEFYLSAKHSIRFAKKGQFLPNIELKFPKIELDEWTLKHKVKVIINNKVLYISPLELQISFKLTLGTEKDIEDARFLYRLFKNNLDQKLLEEFNRKLKIESLFKKYIV